MNLYCSPSQQILIIIIIILLVLLLLMLLLLCCSTYCMQHRFQLQHLFCFLLPFLLETTMRSFCCSSTALRSFCFNTCRVMDRNMSSTLRLSLADVSNSSISICRAKRCASSVITTLRSGSSFLFPTASRRDSKNDVQFKDSQLKTNIYVLQLLHLILC